MAFFMILNKNGLSDFAGQRVYKDVLTTTRGDRSAMSQALGLSGYRSKIIGIGGYVPERVVTNDDLSKIMDTSDEWIVQRSGIRERHWVSPGQTNTDLSAAASQEALKNAGLLASDVDMIVFATLNPDYFVPGNGVLLQERLGAHGIPAIDIRQQCSGFVYAMAIADQFIRTGGYQRVLVVGSEIQSRGIDKTTKGRDVSVLFADGAGAVVMTRTTVADQANDSFLYSSHLHSDGRGAKNLWIPAPGPALDDNERMTHGMIDEGLHYPRMDGRKVFVDAVSHMCTVLIEGLTANELTVNDIDIFFFHQANLRINNSVADHLKIPTEKVFNTIERFGNTTAATIPLGMSEAWKQGKLKPGMRVGIASFGSGYAWGSTILRL